uniref:CCHC-type domain-containing protein n=1 Tax=Catharus ustulatus TaxID=91951 RepID=A0A8C3VBQ2_CATUS
MGLAMSRWERDVFELMQKLLEQHSKPLPSHDLKVLLKWIALKLPGVSQSTIFTTDLWDEVGMKLWDAVTKGDKAVVVMLPSWRAVSEALKAQEKSHAEGKGDAPCPPSTAEAQSSSQSEETGETVPSLSALPTASLLTSKGKRGPSQSLGAFSAGYCPEDSKEGGEEDPSDPASADFDKEPNLFPPDTQDNWVRLKQQALREGDLDIAERIVTPVIYLEEIRELWWALTDHGIRSPFFRSILDSVFAAHTMTPHDLRLFAQLLLTPTQFFLWEKEWEKGVQNLLVSFVGHTNAALANLTIRQLMGTKPYTDPASQARVCLREALDGTQKAARQAFLKVPDAQKPQKAFTSIIQEAQEPYIHFIDCLKQALECQIDNPEAHEILLLKLAVENANTGCKKLLKSLPNQKPTLLEMVEACNRIGTIEHQYKALAAALAAIKSPSECARLCYGCGKPGHLKRDYLAQKGDKSKAPTLCPRCQKGWHFANKCRSKYDCEGRLIQGSRSQGEPHRYYGYRQFSNRCPTCKYTLSLQGQQITLTDIIDTAVDATHLSSYVASSLGPH